METRHRENPITIEKYDNLKTLGRENFAGIDFADQITDAHVARAKEFIRQGANLVAPEVRASYWEHVIIAPELGKRIAEKLSGKLDVNPAEVEMLLWLHDIGRLVTPSTYFRNDLIGDRLLLKAGIPRSIVDNLPPIGNILIKADELQLTESQTRFEEPFTPEQEAIAKEYFESLTPSQRVIFFADNLGKRDERGLFDLDSLYSYLKGYDALYDQTSPWASVERATAKRRATLPLVLYIIQKTVEWFHQNGVDVEEIMTGLEDYGPKFVLIVRHGDLNNPTNVVYNRDSAMGENIIHLSETGVEQMQSLADLIKARRFNLKKIYTSPETRAQESTQELNKKLAVPIEVVTNLDDADASGPYQEGMKMDEFASIKGDVYDQARWGKYNHERPEDIVSRMQNVFNNISSSLSVGETGLMLSHGDPIAWLANYLYSETVPNPSDLRGMIYSAKGQALVTVIGPDNRIFTLYSLAIGAGENSSIY